jgi:hypothetical protein
MKAPNYTSAIAVPPAQRMQSNGGNVSAMADMAAKANHSKLDTYDVSIGAISKSAGNEPAKTSGIKIRGTGCATKGTMARGPMA